MNKQKKLMILGASILQLPAIVKAKDMGHIVIAVDMDENALGFRYADKSLVISTNDIQSVLVAAEELKVDGIITLASDMPMRTVATVSKKLNITGISIDSAIKATDKARMRDALLINGVPIPNYYEVIDFQTYIRKSRNFNDKFIVKPTDSSGSRGIYLVENPKDENELKYAFDYCTKYSKRGKIIIEEYMEGPEVSVETLSIDGEVHIIAITDKLTTGAPRFVEMGHSQPSTLPEEIIEEIESITKKAIEAIGIDFGPSHTEVIVTKEGPKIVEIGARMGGDNITTHLVPLSTGVDMVSACICIALGEAPNIEKKYRKGSAIRYFKIPPGVIKSIAGIERARNMEGIKNLHIGKSVGETVDETINSTSRIGYVISQGENATQAIELCDRAISRIHIILEKECEK
ncbi:MAG: ATP-grasp domain-containing protein [Ignavibacteria bacterium]|nr:ATP-grasp domain-containing protein [Ignavibacteria bacterium]